MCSIFVLNRVLDKYQDGCLAAKTQKLRTSCADEKAPESLSLRIKNVLEWQRKLKVKLQG